MYTTLCVVLWSLLVLLCLAYIRGGIFWPTYIRCSDVSVSVESGRYRFRIYCRSFNFLYVIGHCLYLYAWITLLGHVHVWLPKHANWLYHMYSLGYFLTTPNSHVQILKSEPWWPYRTWAEWQRKRGLAVTCPDPLSSSFSLFGSWDSHIATREYFLVFHIVYPTFALLGDLIFLIYFIMLYDNCVLVSFLL